MGATIMVIMMRESTIRLPTANGFLKSLRIPSRKKVVLLLITSCCRFSSSVAGANLSRSICMLSGFFLGSELLFCSKSIGLLSLVVIDAGIHQLIQQVAYERRRYHERC